MSRFALTFLFPQSLDKCYVGVRLDQDIEALIRKHGWIEPRPLLPRWRTPPRNPPALVDGLHDEIAELAASEAAPRTVPEAIARTARLTQQALEVLERLGVGA